MSSLDLYRALVPAHSAVADATVDLWLGIASRRHTASAWGQLYPEAMVWWVAHQLEQDPGSGVGSSSATAVGPIVSQKDGDLQRSYAAPAVSASGSASAVDSDLATTRYGQRYLDIRDSRAAVQPMMISPGIL